MAFPDDGLARLSRRDPERDTLTIPRPPLRWITRILVPAVILTSASGLLLYSARSALTPATQVWVIPVVATARGMDHAANSADAVTRSGEGASAMLVQAPGWIEPDPYPIYVPALTEGVIREILVLEGERVAAGQVVARLVDADARLAVESMEALLASAQAGVAKAEADVRAAEAQAAETDDRLTRMRKLAATGSAPEGEITQLQFRLSAVQQELVAAEASVAVARANVQSQTVARDEAQLALARTEIVTPAAGVVMARFVEPGSRVSMGGRGKPGTAAESMSGTILRLYDPAKLQVRVDVPLADFARIDVGTPAEVITEALPETVFRGVVSRVVHEANIQRNTVQVKVAIENPMDTLKPEMLARVRFYAKRNSTAVDQHRPVASMNADAMPSSVAQLQGALRLLIPDKVLLDRIGETAGVWIVEHNTRNQATVASQRRIHTRATERSGYVEVIDGLRPGDRVIVNPPASLRHGTRVQVLGEASQDQLIRQGDGA